ncbi:ceruloplasmin-like [Mercenaria mercenaria]|uniref:ceruloplasmin-like n=1 Tax=Mercenaria mercenaria TaxID=6596 RepID=UPI00234F814E|nr:ceruloplasmin-like [Mercenaria mercenaria]
MFATLLTICLGISSASAMERHFYIAAEDVFWNYAPSGRNLVTADSKASSEKIVTGPDRIGNIYKKAIYRGYTDGSFTQRVQVPEWAGFVGPLIAAEVEDVVFIHFRNMATGSNFSVHPHGYQYNKANEGAVYIDGTSGNDKLEDAVPPGGSVTYMWHASRIHGPTDQDDNCYAFTYHSHTMAPKDVDTGLVGVGLICRKGTLDAQGNRIDVDREFYLYADVADENNNWYADEHVLSCGNVTLCQSLKEADNEDFMESNKMSHINGFVYGNLPDFTTCEGENIVWYFMSINQGIHTIHANGQTMIIEKKRTDTAVLHPASVYSGYMTPVNPGRWLLYCRNQKHYDEGMQAFLNVRQWPQLPEERLPEPVGVVRPGYTRRFFIAIEEVLWDYAPGVDINTIPGASTFLERGNNRIGNVYKKAMYVEYADPSFTVRKQYGFPQLHYGLSGPPIKVEEGERVVVVVMNKASRQYSFLANGVRMTKDNEGAYYKNIRMDSQMTGAIVSPGFSRTYEFDVPTEAALTSHNTDCVTYMYHSAVDLTRDIYTGLFGPLLVCKYGTLAPNGRQIGVDREWFLNWMVIDENKSWYIDENIARFTGQPTTVDKSDSEFQLSNKMRAINGRTFGTLNGLQMCTSETVKWHMYGLGGQVDHHHFSFEGNNFKFDNRNLDTASVFPGVGQTVTMSPDQTGQLLLRDGQLGFEAEGMYAWYNVLTCGGQSPRNMPASVLRDLNSPVELQARTANIPKPLLPRMEGIVRRFYIAAVEQNWDYAPIKVDPIDGSSLLNPDHKGYIFIRNDPPYRGTIYYKALYREFTDSTFTKMKQRTPNELHLGVLGPVVNGNVFDTIEIVFRNFATFPYNIIPRNVVFKDGSSITSAPSTMPGETRVYTYIIPERSGPTSKQPNCVGSLYVSRVTPMKDTYSGLVGPFVVCKEGILDSFGRRTDGVTKEFATGFIIFDENKSNYRDVNFANTPPQSITDPDFIESNIMHSINGFIYGNLKGLVFSEMEHSAWYVFGLGSVEDIHTVHYHGQLYIRKTSLTLKRDVLEVFAGTYETVEMLGYNPGTWLFHCHVGAHALEGMETTYTVLPRFDSDKPVHKPHNPRHEPQNPGYGRRRGQKQRNPGYGRMRGQQQRNPGYGRTRGHKQRKSESGQLLTGHGTLRNVQPAPVASGITQQTNKLKQRTIPSRNRADTTFKLRKPTQKKRQRTGQRGSSKDALFHKRSYFAH